MNAPARLQPPITAEFRLGAGLYLCVALVAGAVIALQITIMRIYSVGSWAHFGSLVVSLAMLGFGLTSAAMCVAKGWFERHWQGGAAAALLAFGPLTVVSNLLAQQVPFNAIFLVSDPNQKWRLAANFLLYLCPFLAGAVFLGIMFLKAKTAFARVYFADLAGSGLCGLALLGAMYVIAPESLIVVPLALWFLGGLCWNAALPSRRFLAGLAAAGIASLAVQLGAPGLLGIPNLATSDYKGVAYARKFPDAKRVYGATSPFGLVEVYSSSYLHFAPGLSDNAAFNLPTMPANAYLAMYVDGDGPIGIIKALPASETGYYRYLPMIYPYLLKEAPDTFVAQLGGGISASVALAGGSRRVTVAEGNPAILHALRDDPYLKDFTGDLLGRENLRVIDHDGRLFLASTRERYDVIDLSLADSAGLSNPGGFAIVEKFAYSQEAMGAYMRALKDGGILSVTLWNKEEPPKSILKLYSTMAGAGRDLDPATLARSFFVASSYLSTATVLYKRGGFTEAELARLREHTRAMSFDEIYSPGFAFDDGATAATLESYTNQIFFDLSRQGGQPGIGPTSEPAEGTDKPEAADPEPGVLPSITLGRLAWHHLIAGTWGEVAKGYVFDTRPLTNDRPYFAAYVRPGDLPKVTDRLELLQDEWGYLLLWATLGVACVAALGLVTIPVAFGWRSIFSRAPGKAGTIVYFACLGLGYIMVEVGLIANFVLALSNATVSASVLITGMLVFSGLGSFVSERFHGRVRSVMPKIFLGIGALLVLYAFGLGPVLNAIGALPYGLRLLCCFVLIFPPAFLMGFPMPTAMAALARLGKDHLFIWAWGINGCFSVVGAALVPLVATAFGMSAVLLVSAAAYCLAIPALFAVLKPMRADRPATLAALAPGRA